MIQGKNDDNDKVNDAAIEANETTIKKKLL